ncbi:MAG: 1-deoxy-D-xylulose-5-phosphate reductoisomerase [Micavibrio aeruginosavorus]|uniref:1-deoxy-D-xylulose 5-phosphate reductoisomerase n=1 Tax=Micavibrio aeruginosavorus TaxID=349221 RepID=A0A2W5MUT2_9BACT|nr:MAG: 1-deoxy-D-xylulose-5-phosphate reductoisomerase [Micavibrio aeruginosavorus]
MKSVSILGATGSVGTATINVLRQNRETFSVCALTAQKNVKLLAEQAREFNAKLAVIGDESLYAALKDALSGTSTQIAAGRKAVIEAAATPCDYTMAAIVGMAGLEPILAAIRNGKHVAVANKEPLVAAGALVMDAAKKSGAALLPVDSEHNAIFQVYDFSSADKIRRVILTASGGPFRTWPKERMESATPSQAVAHPNWSMGAKISVDSATMMNKALEVIEAHYLFNLPADRIDVLVHPQSVIHSMVEYHDGSVLAQMGAPDMQVPIAHTLGWPNRMNNGGQRIDFTKISNLTFEPVDDCRFPAINYAYHCLSEGQAACIAMNAANEVAVAAFLDGQAGYLDIFETVRKTVEERTPTALDDLESILAFDAKMRESAKNHIMKYKTESRKVS